MSMKLVKRIMAVTMAAALMIAPALTAFAATEEAKPTEPEPAPIASVPVEKESVVAVGGEVIKSQTAGVYSVETLAGVAVKETPANIKAAAGLAANETPFVRAYDITEKKSPAAYASFKGAAASVGGEVLGAVNVDLGKLTAGKYSELPAGVSVPMTIGVKKAPAGKTLAAVKVSAGGATEILADTDTNPNTVTFPITGGLSAYAVIAY